MVLDASLEIGEVRKKSESREGSLISTVDLSALTLKNASLTAQCSFHLINDVIQSQRRPSLVT